MEALAKTKPQPQSDGFPTSKPLSSISKNEQGPDYRLYKSEPELTTVKEEESDEPHPPEERGGGVTERREVPVTKVTPCPVGIVPPRTKCTISPPESTTIASYVTLRKKKPEPKAERPHSALDPAGGFGEREPGRIRMSVEEQLERMRRNQEACTLRRNKLSRSASFNRDQNPALATQQSGQQTEGGCTDPCGLEAALQRLKDVTASLNEGEAPASEKVVQPEEEDSLKEGPGDREKPTEITESKSPDTENCEHQTAVILEVSAQPQAVKVMELQPFEDLSSSANSPSDHSLQTPEPEWSPDGDESRDMSQDSSTDLHLNNMLSAQPMTLVSSDT